MMLSKLRSILIVKLLLLFVVGFLLLPPTIHHSEAQDDMSSQVFIWREAALALEYPADWHVGFFEDLPIVTNTASGLALASIGEAPGEPAMSFLFYPQAKNLGTRELMDVVFPEVEVTEHWLGIDGLQAEFAHEETGQMVRIIAFKSPATQASQILVASAPQDIWEDFVPILDSMLNSIQFLNDTAELEFFDAIVKFEYFDEWVETNNGQVLIAAPTLDAANSILDGEIENASPFIQAQLLVPSGIGVDPDSETAAEDILLRFVGSPDRVDHLQRFDWAEGMPAASAFFEFNGLQLVIVVVVNGDTAMIVSGGATVNQWSEVQRMVIGSINLTQFGEATPPRDLTQIITGQLTDDDATTRPLG